MTLTECRKGREGEKSEQGREREEGEEEIGEGEEGGGKEREREGRIGQKTEKTLQIISLRIITCPTICVAYLYLHSLHVH